MKGIAIAVLAVASVLSLTGCTIAMPTYGPDGREAHVIQCTGAGLTWNNCLQKAGEICGRRGYNVIERNGERVTTTAVAASGTSEGRTVLSASGDSQRTMMVSCK